MFFLNKRHPTFFVTKNFDGHIIKEFSNIILSPEFYWSKRVSLDVKFIYEVKQLAASIFDDVLPDGEFEYLAYKISKNEYIILAYDIKNILQELHKLQIDTKLIDKIYLFDSEFAGVDIAIKIDQKYGLAFNDGVFVVVPLKYLKFSKSIDDILKDKKVSSRFIYSSRYKHLKITTKEFNLLISIVLLFSIFLLVDTTLIYKRAKQLDRYREDFISEYNLPTTSLQIKSIYSQLKKEVDVQMELRKILNYLSRYRFKKGEYFKIIEYRDRLLSCKVKLLSKKDKKSFVRYVDRISHRYIKLDVAYDK